MARHGLSVVIVLVALSSWAQAQTAPCGKLTGERKKLAEKLLSSQYLYDCCDQTVAECLLVDRGEAANMLPPRPRDGHKGTFGHLLVVAGSLGKSGAAVMVAESALRGGESREGDLLVSSGMGGVFPKGLPLGLVTAVKTDQFSLFQQVTAQTTTDFSHLEEVMVIVGDDQ